MIDNSDRSWQRLGAIDPYYAVITVPEYHRGNLDAQTMEKFFATGEEHVARLLAVVRKHLDPEFKPQRVLDFGCGVGRLIIPLAKLSKAVVGIDISEQMLDEARSNCEKRAINNVDFALSDDNLSRVSGTFNLIHSYIVFQHIPRLRGERIFKRMLALLEPGGIGAIHFTYARRSSLFRRLTLWSRKSIPLVNGIRNLINNQPFDYPMMQLNEYDLSRIFRLLQDNGCGHAYAQYSAHTVVDTSAYGAMIFFQKRLQPPW